jgi:hypothetical protein
MSPTQRLEAAAQMSEDVRALAASGIRARQPGLSEAEVQAALVRLLVGRELEWAMTSGSARQMADVSALLDVGRETMDLEYIDRWAESLGVGDAWRTVRDAG